jgi:hypothetical protein
LILQLNSVSITAHKYIDAGCKSIRTKMPESIYKHPKIGHRCSLYSLSVSTYFSRAVHHSYIVLYQRLSLVKYPSYNCRIVSLAAFHLSSLFSVVHLYCTVLYSIYKSEVSTNISIKESGLNTDINPPSLSHIPAAKSPPRHDQMPRH